MVDYKFVTDNLPDQLEELTILANEIASTTVVTSNKYIYDPNGIIFHSGTQFTKEGKCQINLTGCLVIHLLGKNYDINSYYSPAFFSVDIQRKLNKCHNDVLEKNKTKGEE